MWEKTSQKTRKNISFSKGGVYCLKISKRLQAVANYIIGHNVADIGSDHAHLPCYLIKKKLAKYVIAGEVAEGPFLSAKLQVKLANYDDVIAVRRGYGLAVITDQETIDTITICGMGGNLITKILAAGTTILNRVRRLVLQPNDSELIVRKWLGENNWLIFQEEIVEENKHIYEIIVAQKGYAEKLTPCELLMGRHLIKANSLIFQKKWTAEADQIKNILPQIAVSNNKAALKRRRKELLAKLRCINEILVVTR